MYVIKLKLTALWHLTHETLFLFTVMLYVNLMITAFSLTFLNLQTMGIFGWISLAFIREMDAYYSQPSLLN